MTKIHLIILLIALSVSFILPFEVLAQGVIESDNYEIQLPNLNSGAGIPSSANYLLDSTIGQTAPGLFSSTGYRVRSGFEYIHSVIPFSFTISEILIDLGDLVISTPSTDTTTLTVKAGGAGGYSIKAFESHPLENEAQTATIADTTCDTGTCSQTTAQVWTQNTIYGFGFNISGDDVPADFTDSTYFRQFADASAPETPATIMTKSEVTWDYPNNTWPWESSATVTFKVNIGANQTGGTYRNSVTFIAIPSF